jgi:hypothetical protein
MNRNLKQEYMDRIGRFSTLIQDTEEIMLRDFWIDTLTLKQSVASIVDRELQWEELICIDTIKKYNQSVEQFLIQHGDKDTKEQIGKLFGFRPDKLIGRIKIIQKWPVLQISFSEMQDLLSVKFAKRKDTFTQEDKASWFFKVLRFDWYEIPVCVALESWNEQKTITHEMTHFRNSLIGMSHYSQGGWIDAYEQVTYDDLQEEILAFFSEWIWRAAIQIAIWHDQRYHFYRRLEDINEETYQRFMKDTNFFINIAREIKELRPESYLYELALIPLKKWRRYLGYLQHQPKKAS